MNVFEAFKAFIRSYTIVLTFVLFVAIIQQTEFTKGIIAVALFIACMWCAIEQNEQEEFKA